MDRINLESYDSIYHRSFRIAKTTPSFSIPVMKIAWHSMHLHRIRMFKTHLYPSMNLRRRFFFTTHPSRPYTIHHSYTSYNSRISHMTNLSPWPDYGPLRSSWREPYSSQMELPIRSQSLRMRFKMDSSILLYSFNRWTFHTPQVLHSSLVIRQPLIPLRLKSQWILWIQPFLL